EVLPAILVVGASFAATQWFWSNHMDSNLVDISAGIVSLVVTLLFLRVWQPKRIWRFADERDAVVAGGGDPGFVGTTTEKQKPGSPTPTTTASGVPSDLTNYS